MSGVHVAASLYRRARGAAPVGAALAALVAAAYGVKALARFLVPSTPELLPDALGGVFASTPASVGRTTTAFGFLLVGAWLAGRVAKAFGLPRISGYLVLGVLAGPSMAELAGIPALVSTQELANLKLIEGLAVSMIAFVAGSEIKFSFVRSALGTIARILRGEFLGVAPAVWLLLAAIVLLCPLPEPLAQAGIGVRLFLAAVVAILAVADAPAVTIALIRELRPAPAFAQLALANTVLKDVVLVVLFSALLSAGIVALGPSDVLHSEAAAGVSAAPAGGAPAAAMNVTAAAADATAESSANSLWWLPFTIGMHLVGSLILGGVVAAVLWALGRFLSMRIELFMVLVCFGIAVVSAELAADPLLVALTAGILLANIGASRAMPRLLASMDGLLLPVYCVFFAVAGAKVHLDAVAMVWPAMVAVVAVRLVAKHIAVTRAARRAGVAEPIASWLWTSTLPQAGVTLAMAIQFERSFDGHPWTPVVSALLLSTVACNELIGPPLMKLGIQRTAEAPR